MHNPKPETIFQHRSVRETDVTKPRLHSDKTVYNLQPHREARKILVRHPEQAVNPTVYRTDIHSETKNSNRPGPKSSSHGLYKTELSAPNLNSALRIVKEIKQAAQLKTSLSECTRLVDEGKVLQQVNFPYEEHLYHDLVALNVSEVGTTGAGSSARSQNKYKMRERDKEPHLSQFFNPPYIPECAFTRAARAHVLENLHCCDSVPIYHRISTWDVREVLIWTVKTYPIREKYSYTSGEILFIPIDGLHLISESSGATVLVSVLWAYCAVKPWFGNRVRLPKESS